MHWIFVTILPGLGALFYILDGCDELELLNLLSVLHCCWFQDLSDAEFKVRNGCLDGKTRALGSSAWSASGHLVGGSTEELQGVRTALLKIKKGKTSFKYLFAPHPASRKHQ